LPAADAVHVVGAERQLHRAGVAAELRVEGVEHQRARAPPGSAM
jgi:hypothetical protein